MKMETPESLRTKANRYRDMTLRVNDQRGRLALLTLADKFSAFAAQLEGATPRRTTSADARRH